MRCNNPRPSPFCFAAYVTQQKMSSLRNIRNKTTVEASGTTCRFNELRLTMFQKDAPNKFPVLRGKAAEIRHFAAALLHAGNDFLRESERPEKLMKKLLQLAVRMEVLLDEHADSFKFPPPAQKEFENSATAFAQVNAALAHHFHASGIRLFNHTIKFHYMHHLAVISRRVNPRIGWCYSGEDLMHRVKLMMRAAHRGAGPVVVVPKVMRKYAHGLGMVLAGAIPDSPAGAP